MYEMRNSKNNRITSEKSESGAEKVQWAYEEIQETDE